MQCGSLSCFGVPVTPQPTGSPRRCDRLYMWRATIGDDAGDSLRLATTDLPPLLPGRQSICCPRRCVSPFEGLPLCRRMRQSWKGYLFFLHFKQTYSHSFPDRFFNGPFASISMCSQMGDGLSNLRVRRDSSSDSCGGDISSTSLEDSPLEKLQLLDIRTTDEGEDMRNGQRQTACLQVFACPPGFPSSMASIVHHSMGCRGPRRHFTTVTPTGERAVTYLFSTHYSLGSITYIVLKYSYKGLLGLKDY